MFGSKGKPIKKGDLPITRKGAVKGAHAPAKGETKQGRQPGGTGGNKNVAK
jgi:hypothetical protein